MSGLRSPRLFVMMLACFALLLTACDKSSSGSATPTLTATLAATATATIPPTGNLATVKLSLTPVVRGLMRPDFLTTAHDGTGRLYITQQSGESGWRRRMASSTASRSSMSRHDGTRNLA